MHYIIYIYYIFIGDLEIDIGVFQSRRFPGNNPCSFNLETVLKAHQDEGKQNKKVLVK